MPLLPTDDGATIDTFSEDEEASGEESDNGSDEENDQSPEEE